MAITLDLSPVTVVITCTECPWWAAIALDRFAAHATATKHERDVHPEAMQASKAASLYKLRHAV